MKLHQINQRFTQVMTRRRQVFAVAIMGCLAAGASRIVAPHYFGSAETVGTRVMASSASEPSAAVVYGPNSLMGRSSESTSSVASLTPGQASVLVDEHLTSSISLADGAETSPLERLHLVTAMNDEFTSVSVSSGPILAASAVPEPATIGLFAIGIVAGLVRPRKQSV